MMAKFVQGIGLDEEDLAWDAYEEVGPGGHFLGSQHTMRHYETAFYQHAVFNMDNYEKWESEGAEDTYKRANAVWKRMLQEYQPPALDEGVKEALLEFTEKRRAEIRAGRLVRE
jgi:trimethylamine--corrinoid protein Co-methyltransferase